MSYYLAVQHACRVRAIYSADVTFLYLARSTNLPEGLYILFALISFFLMIVLRQIISGSAGPIFVIFSPNDIGLF